MYCMFATGTKAKYVSKWLKRWDILQVASPSKIHEMATRVDLEKLNWYLLNPRATIEKNLKEGTKNNPGVKIK